MDSFQELFSTVPYAKTVDCLGEDESVFLALPTKQSHTSLVQDLETKVKSNKLEVMQDLESLKIRFVDPVQKFYVKAMHSGPNLFSRLEQIKKGVHHLSNDGNSFGALIYTG
jgi:hypothetical protein